MSSAKHRFRRLFSGLSDNLLPLVLLGVATGLAASLVMICFLVLLNGLLGVWNGASLEDFESLPRGWQLGLPVAGSLLLILLYRLTPASAQAVGLAYVLERLQFGQGRLPAANIGFQFLAALIALGSGHSVGREGPAVHLGAGIASQLGQYVHRPPSQLRLLVGCGTAAAISAAFNTPLAGVLFAMEVVLMEYSLLGFAPIIAAAVTASAVSGLLLGAEPILLPVTLSLASYRDIPGLLLTGVGIGLTAVLFHRLVRLFLRLPLPSRDGRLLLAGLLAGTLALAAPQILGSGYDTINVILGEGLPWPVLLLILAAKLLATAAAIGLGVPGGQIAPTLMLGVCAGGIAGALVPGTSDPGLYALLGMAAMMGAVLHAPLAALATVLELSLSAEAMLPAMIVVLGANLVCQHGFRQPSLVITLLRARGRVLQTHPLRTGLAQRYLSELAGFRFAEFDADGSGALAEVLHGGPEQVVVRLGGESYLVGGDRLAALLQEHAEAEPRERALRRLLLPRRRLVELTGDASLLTAIKSLQQEEGAGFLLPVGRQGLGLVTRAQLVEVLTGEGGLH
ncbi:chloride transporter ClC family protein [Zobellella endophytica]|uniref:Chloride transporter ClC family protein n=1 Tax=Zobellella endophytica TaxID=2116700 RepID=A0A2P7R932_9GAMM|nr:chloride channel protein [Zobellella endophytica]PSJ46738.1 chloride transporter ClC family protein [Zobellella endophytica]